MKAQRCKGFRDLSPVDMERFRLIEDTFRNTCLKRCYREVRTPTIEYLHLFTSTGTLTPSLLNRVYSFLDWDGWSGERVVLRPDGTIPVARMYIESMEEEALAKLFYITNIFVFEETGKENREKWQCGVELIGAGSPLADVELISMAIEVLHLLKFKNIVLKLSHAGLIKALLAGLGLSHEEQTGLFDKILDGDINVLNNIKPEKSVLGKKIIELLEQKGNSKGLLENLKSLSASKLPEMREPLDDFIKIINLLDILNISYQIDMDTGRGFEYYTGIIFHLSINEQYVIGGGRYDALIPFMNGKDTPACGCALYLDRIMSMIIPSDFENTESRNSCLVIVDPLFPGTVKTGFKLAEDIRNAGIKAEINLGTAYPEYYNWTIKIKEDFTFSLFKKTSTIINIAETTEDVLKLVKHERANKNSASKRSSSR
jgi:histidyl-tRNA synthetase